MSDLINRQDAIDILDDFEADIELGKRDAYKTHREKLLSIHSAYHPLCALADRECPFQGKEFAWCLTCPHISEEDRELVKKAVAEPKTGKWEYDPNGMDWNIPAWRCSECGYVAPHIGIADKGIGSNPMNWAGSKYCPECGCKIVGASMTSGKG